VTRLLHVPVNKTLIDVFSACFTTLLCGIGLVRWKMHEEGDGGGQAVLGTLHASWMRNVTHKRSIFMRHTQFSCFRPPFILGPTTIRRKRETAREKYERVTQRERSKRDMTERDKAWS